MVIQLRQICTPSRLLVGLLKINRYRLRDIDRQPERLAEFRQWNGGCGLTIQRFPAVDGATVDEATRRTVVTDDAYSANPSIGGVGCRLSHQRLWKYSTDVFKPIVVF